jgi:hypothetical protein
LDALECSEFSAAAAFARAVWAAAWATALAAAKDTTYLTRAAFALRTYAIGGIEQIRESANASMVTSLFVREENNAI